MVFLQFRLNWVTYSTILFYPNTLMFARCSRNTLYTSGMITVAPKFWNYDVERTRAFHLWLLRTSKLLLLSNTKVLKSLTNNKHIRTLIPTNGFAMVILCLSLAVQVSSALTRALKAKTKIYKSKSIVRRSLFTPFAIICKHIILLPRSSGYPVFIVITFAVRCLMVIILPSALFPPLKKVTKVR